jgi:magnesium-transporting ATPase (P-type)
MKQSKVMLWLGGFKDVLIMSFVWVSVINFAFVAAVTYSTTLRPSLPDSFAWFSPWVFMGVMAVVFIVIMYVEWRWVYPSFYAFRNKQEYSHQNLLKSQLDQIERRQKLIMEKLGIKEEETE